MNNKLKIAFIIIVLMISAIPLAYAYSQTSSNVIINPESSTNLIGYNENLLNDSSTTTNLTYTTVPYVTYPIWGYFEDQIFYLKLPKKSNITSAYANFTGLPYVREAWDTNDTVISGLGSISVPSPETFRMDNKWNVIIGDWGGTFTGYTWTGSTWNSNSTLTSGLSDLGQYTSPSVFYTTGQGFTTGYKMITSANFNPCDFHGYYWNSSAWTENSSIAPPNVASTFSCAITTFYNDNKWNLIVGQGDGFLRGYDWNGTTWNSNATVVSGVSGDYGNLINQPKVFVKNNSLTLIVSFLPTSGRSVAGYTWSGSSWIGDNMLVKLMPGYVGSLSVNQFAVFNESDKFKMIAKNTDGNWHGYEWKNTSIYPYHPLLDTGGLGGAWEWQYSGSTFNTTEKVDLSSAQLNIALTSCSPDTNGNCNVPMKIRNNEMGIMNVNYINITYDYNTTYLFNITGKSWNQTDNVKANSNYWYGMNISNTSNLSSDSISAIGYTIINQTSKCFLNGEKDVLNYLGTNYCPLSFSVNQGSLWSNHFISNATAIPISKVEQTRVQDTSMQSRVGINSYSAMPVNVTWNASAYISGDTTNFTNVNVTSTIPSGFNANLSSWIIPTLNVSQTNTTNATFYANKIIYQAITSEATDTDYQTRHCINATGAACNWNYFITNVTVNNTDTINYNNVIWNASDIIAYPDYNYSTNISGGSLDFTSGEVKNNIEMKYRLTPITAVETVIQDDASGYEKFIQFECLSNCDRYNTAGLIDISTTVNDAFTNYSLYYWDGSVWIDITNNISYVFSQVGNTSSWRVQHMSLESFDVISLDKLPTPNPGTGGGGGGYITEIINITAPVCGDGICGEGESTFSCPLDCKGEIPSVAYLFILIIVIAMLYVIFGR